MQIVACQENEPVQTPTETTRNVILVATYETDVPELISNAASRMHFLSPNLRTRAPDKIPAESSILVSRVKYFNKTRDPKGHISFT